MAERILALIENPVSEFYTHPGNQALVHEVEMNPEAYERRIGAFLLAMQDAYESFKTEE